MKKLTLTIHPTPKDIILALGGSVIEHKHIRECLDRDGYYGVIKDEHIHICVSDSTRESIRECLAKSNMFSFKGMSPEERARARVQNAKLLAGAALMAKEYFK